MRIAFFGALLLATSFSVSLGTEAPTVRRIAISSPDPYILQETINPGYFDAKGLTARSADIDTAKKTLVLLIAGQSIWTSITPSAYTPSHSIAIDVLNVYDGALYPPDGRPVLSTSYSPAVGIGNIGLRVAEQLVANSVFDRVILADVAIGSTDVSMWDPSASGILANRPIVAIKRLAARGITPATDGVTFAFLWGQGESDTLMGTTETAYASALNSILSNLTANGFSGRIFVCKETWFSGGVSSAVQAAQTGIVDNTTIFSGGDLDTLNASNRVADNTHFNDTGAAAAATIVYNAMVASGSPF